MTPDSTNAQRIVQIARSVQPQVSVQNGQLIVQNGSTQIKIPIAPARVLSQASYRFR